MVFYVALSPRRRDPVLGLAWLFLHNHVENRIDATFTPQKQQVSLAVGPMGVTLMG